ncbi:helicase [Fragilaria crotonensis]|nr:helicase [Fragilaria crotonensis]
MRPGFDEIWNRHLQNMIAYQKKHGHLLFRRKCSDKDNTLKTWISTQRKVFRKGKMPADRMEKLKAANFVWNPEDTYEKRWEEKYAELSRFYEAHGHLIIPPRKKHAALNTWIRNQRVLREGGKLSQDRIDRLDKLQFSWTEPEVNPGLVDQHCLENTASGPHLERWKASFKRLIEFNERFGHFDVNTTDDMALNQWIYQQRLRHRKGLLQKERADWLESIGFEWNVENGNQADEEWNLMFTKLKDFKEKNGHFAHRMMRAWVRTQNSTQCRDRPDRRAMLEEIGFPFQEVDAFGSSLPPTRSIPRKRTAPDSGEKCGDKEVTLKGRKPLGATKKPRRRSDRSNKIVTQEESGLYGKQCDNSSSPFAPMQSLSKKQTAQESCGKYEDEVVTRTGGKPKADRKSRKTRGDSKTNKAAKTGSSLLAFSRNCWA